MFPAVKETNTIKKNKSNGAVFLLEGEIILGQLVNGTVDGHEMYNAHGTETIL